ncbi:MAG TPA: hypothetical protein VHA07_00765 [Devosia sp.]|nr:hypothetical protein [Devosia sp.]
MTTLSRFIALSFAATVAAASLSIAWTPVAEAGPNIPIVKIPIQNGNGGNGNGNGGNGTPYIPIIVFPDPPKPKIPILILDDGVGSGGPNTPAVHTQPHALEVAIDCRVKAEDGLDGDLWIINTGEAPISAGTAIRFRVPSTGDHGAFELNRSILPGARVKVPDLLHGAEGGAPCGVQIIG